MVKKFTLSKKELIKSEIIKECKTTGREFNTSTFDMWYSWITSKEAPNNVLHFDRLFNGYCTIDDKNSTIRPNNPSKEQEQVDKINELKSAMLMVSNLEDKLQKFEFYIIKNTSGKNVSSYILSNRIRYGLKNMMKFPENKWSSIVEIIITNIQQENEEEITNKSNELKLEFKVSENKVVSFNKFIQA